MSGAPDAPIDSGPARNGSIPGADDWQGDDRRESDRRARPTRAWNGLRAPVRRQEGRRAEDDVESYVDVYTKRDVALFLAVFLLNVADAFFTMLWLGRGGREANPVMDFFLDIGPHAFLIQKCFVVGFWLLILIVHKNFRVARFGLYAALVVYAGLLLVHFGILAFDVRPPEEAAVHRAHNRPVVMREVERRSELTRRPTRVLERPAAPVDRPASE